MGMYYYNIEYPRNPRVQIRPRAKETRRRWEGKGEELVIG